MSKLDLVLPIGITVDVMLAYTVGLGTFISVVIAYHGLTVRRIHADRTDVLKRYRAHLAKDIPSSRQRMLGSGGMVHNRIINLCLLYARTLRSSQSDRVRRRLIRAGHRTNESLAIYVCFKFILPLLFMGASGWLLYIGFPTLLAGFYRPVAIIAMVLIGSFTPEAVVFNAASKRRLALQRGLPDGLDLLVICAEAGLSLDSALNRVAVELARSSPEIADELGITGVELNFLPERRAALENLAERIALPAVQGVVSTLIQTERYGTPLSQSLRVLSAEFRDKRMLQAEEKAARLPATLTVPMILFILPTLFVVLVGPAMIDVYDRIAH